THRHTLGTGDVAQVGCGVAGNVGDVVDGALGTAAGQRHGLLVQLQRADGGGVVGTGVHGQVRGDVVQSRAVAGTGLGLHPGLGGDLTGVDVEDAVQHRG